MDRVCSCNTENQMNKLEFAQEALCPNCGLPLTAEGTPLTESTWRRLVNKIRHSQRAFVAAHLEAQDGKPGFRYLAIGLLLAVAKLIGGAITWAALMAGSQFATGKGLLSIGSMARSAARGSVLYAGMMGLLCVGSGVWLTFKSRPQSGL